MAKHISKQELKHDVVHDYGERIMEFFDLHRTKILGGLLGLAVLILAIRVGGAIAERRAESVSSRLNELYDQYSVAIMAQDADAMKSEIEKLVKQADDMIAQNASSFAGREALLIKGNVHRIQEEYDKAIETLQNYLERAKNASEKAKGQVALGCVYEDQFFENRENKELGEKAKAAYAKAQELGTEGESMNAFGAEAAISLARVHEMMGEFDQAKALYEAVLAQRVFDDEPAEQDEKLDAKADRDAQAKMIRDGIRRSQRRFAFKETATERLERIKARQQ